MRAPVVSRARRVRASGQASTGHGALGRLATGPASAVLAALVALVALAIALALSACGSSAKDQTVARVAGTPISKAELEHWMRIESVLTYQGIPKQAPPSGLYPDPPSFSACIAWLSSPRAPVATRLGKLSRAQLKHQCEALLAGLRRKALALLITYQWQLQEAKQLGLTPREAEVQAALRQFREHETPNPGEFQRYLSYAHMSLADAQYIQRLAATGTKLLNAISTAGGASSPARALAAFTQKWVQRTDCKAGYVVPGCRQYEGPEPPP